VSEAGQLRRDIQHTRAELGETVQALAARADVRARVGNAADDLAAEFREAARTAGGRLADSGRRLTDGGRRHLADGGRRLADSGRRLSEPPLRWVLLGGSVAAALGIAALIWGRRRR
jgi:hypothetical protein